MGAAKQAPRLEDDVKAARLKQIKNAAKGFNNGYKNPRLEEEYFKSLKVPNGNLDIINALNNLTQAKVVTTGVSASRDLHLVDRGAIPVLVVAVGVAVQAIFVITTALIAMANRPEWSGSSGMPGTTPGRLDSVPYPSIYVPPCFIQTGQTGVPDDPEPDWPSGPFTMTCSGEPGGSPPTGAKPPSSGPCSTLST